MTAAEIRGAVLTAALALSAYVVAGSIDLATALAH